MKDTNNANSSGMQSPIPIIDPGPAELSAAGHWGETQVIESIKQANFRHKSPSRVFSGQATQPLGGAFHPVGDGSSPGRLIIPKLCKRTRLKRFLKCLIS
jgi:hypothetical protein